MEKQSTHRAEKKIAAYIGSHFRNANYSKLTQYRTGSGTAYYRAEVSHENSIYHLQFNQQGLLTKKDRVPLIELLDEDFGVVD
jgi:hypothetical protein